MNYYLSKDIDEMNTAGSKAPSDVAQICEKIGFKCLLVPHSLARNMHLKVLRSLWREFTYWFKLNQLIGIDDVVLYQHPFYGKQKFSSLIGNCIIHFNLRRMRRKCCLIAVIHDLDSLRVSLNPLEGSLKSFCGNYADGVLLEDFDFIICHNKHMNDYLVSQGFAKDRILNLEIFDYLCDDLAYKTERHCSSEIAIAGNLAGKKSAYIYRMFGKNRETNSNLRVNLYGVNYDEHNANMNISYQGVFSPEELPSHLKGSFGLVWDGISAETCAGNTGEYLKYNNPHKTSLYLASGMPVIVWRQAAIADFVLENGVGIAVDSLYGLDEVISNIPENEYRIMCINAEKVGEKIRSGYYFTTALEKCMNMIGG